MSAGRECMITKNRAKNSGMSLALIADAVLAKTTAATAGAKISKGGKARRSLIRLAVGMLMAMVILAGEAGEAGGTKAEKTSSKAVPAEHGPKTGEIIDAEALTQPAEAPHEGAPRAGREAKAEVAAADGAKEEQAKAEPKAEEKPNDVLIGGRQTRGNYAGPMRPDTRNPGIGAYSRETGLLLPAAGGSGPASEAGHQAGNGKAAPNNARQAHDVPSQPHGAQETQGQDGLEGLEPEAALKKSEKFLISSNLVGHALGDGAGSIENFRRKVEAARSQQEQRNFAQAGKLLLEALEMNLPDEVKRGTWLQLAVVSQEEGKLAQAQRTFTEFLKRYPLDPGVPEVLLRQGLIYREMGLPHLALSKFYAVMTSALGIKTGRLPDYQRLVLQAQTEVADTHFSEGRHAEAAGFYKRLLKLNSPLLNKPLVHYKWVNALERSGKYTDAIPQAEEFLRIYPEAEEEPEVRYLLAMSLQALGRKGDALREVMDLLEAQQKGAAQNPERWSYWKQRTGMEIANQLFEEGDAVHAVEIYMAILPLNNTPGWQWPVSYQAGLAYEKLEQPQKAMEQYERILQQSTGGKGQEAASKTLPAMAKWRRDLLAWQIKTGPEVADLTAPGKRAAAAK